MCVYVVRDFLSPQKDHFFPPPPANTLFVLGSIFLNIGAFFNMSGTITIRIFDPRK
jgi:hypothetical protein